MSEKKCPCGVFVVSKLQRHKDKCVPLKKITVLEEKIVELEKLQAAAVDMLRTLSDGNAIIVNNPSVEAEYYDKVREMIHPVAATPTSSLVTTTPTPAPAPVADTDTDTEPPAKWVRTNSWGAVPSSKAPIVNVYFPPTTRACGFEAWPDISEADAQDMLNNPLTCVMRMVRLLWSNEANHNFRILKGTPGDGSGGYVAMRYVYKHKTTSYAVEKMLGFQFFRELVASMTDKLSGLRVIYNILPDADDTPFDNYCREIDVCDGFNSKIVAQLTKSIVSECSNKS